jgi:hypothetical protein
MSVFRKVTPQPPAPTDQPDVQREADHLRSTKEAKDVVDQLIAMLDQFEPTQFTTADGFVVRALAQKLGQAPPTTVNDFSLYDAGGGYLGITNGTVEGVLPTGMLLDNIPPFKIAVSATGAAWLTVTFDTDPTSDTYALPTDITPAVGATIPDDTDGVGHLPLGGYFVSGGSVTVTTGAQGIGSQLSNYFPGISYFWPA